MDYGLLFLSAGISQLGQIFRGLSFYDDPSFPGKSRIFPLQKGVTVRVSNPDTYFIVVDVNTKVRMANTDYVCPAVKMGYLNELNKSLKQLYQPKCSASFDMWLRIIRAAVIVKSANLLKTNNRKETGLKVVKVIPIFVYLLSKDLTCATLVKDTQVYMVNRKEALLAFPEKNPSFERRCWTLSVFERWIIRYNTSYSCRNL